MLASLVRAPASLVAAAIIKSVFFSTSTDQRASSYALSTFSSQVKSECTLKAQDFGSKFELPKTFVKNVLKTGIADELTALSKFKEMKDHDMGDGTFMRPAGSYDDKAFGELCALGRKHKNLYLKLSAHFRVSSQDAPHTDLQPRFDAAVDAFGADRLMWGSDFPFVQLNGGQQASLEAVRKFSSALAPEAQDAILGGTARRLFRLP